MKPLDVTVFPSEEKTIFVQDDPIYGGAHYYEGVPSLGFTDGKAQYSEGRMSIQFVQKNDDGTMIAGWQSEQLALILLDRVNKLNARFPSAQNVQMAKGLKMFLSACEDRVRERMERGVMGDLKK